MTKLISCILAAWLLTACGQATPPKEIGTIDISSLTELDNDPNHYRVLVYFDGGCSSCIKQMIDWVKLWNEQVEPEGSTSCLFVSQTVDPMLVEYYLEQFKTPLRDKDALMCDEGKLAQINTALQNASFKIMLLNGKGGVMADNDPFTDRKTKKLYRQLNILQ